MTDQEVLAACVDLHHKHVDLMTRSKDVVSVDDFHIQVRPKLFEALFPDGPDNETESEEYIHRVHTYRGTRIVALYEKEAASHD